MPTVLTSLFMLMSHRPTVLTSLFLFMFMSTGPP